MGKEGWRERDGERERDGWGEGIGREESDEEVGKGREGAEGGKREGNRLIKHINALLNNEKLVRTK